MITMYELYYGKVLRIYVYGTDDVPAVRMCRELLRELGHTEVDAPAGADLAIAPLLERKLSRAEYSAPRLGTLIFHPSLLPMYKGRDAIKQAYRAGDTYTGVTWFWANDELDGGEICEQAVVIMDRSLQPGEFYRERVLLAMVGTLRRALSRGK